jgi:PIN domain nuclease of toxin-antitoxin system
MSHVPAATGYLLDTSVTLIGLERPGRLSRQCRAALLPGPNVIGVVTYWEAALDQLAATSLPVRSEHVGELQNLPALHSDPFDRILVAQATAESLAFVTTDGQIRRYGSARLRVIS